MLINQGIVIHRDLTMCRKKTQHSILTKRLKALIHQTNMASSVRSPLITSISITTVVILKIIIKKNPKTYNKNLRI